MGHRWQKKKNCQGSLKIKGGFQSLLIISLIVMSTHSAVMFGQLNPEIPKASTFFSIVFPLTLVWCCRGDYVVRHLMGVLSRDFLTRTYAICTIFKEEHCGSIYWTTVRAFPHDCEGMRTEEVSHRGREKTTNWIVSMQIVHKGISFCCGSGESQQSQ